MRGPGLVAEQEPGAAGARSWRAEYTGPRWDSAGEPLARPRGQERFLEKFKLSSERWKNTIEGA